MCSREATRETSKDLIRDQLSRQRFLLLFARMWMIEMRVTREYKTRTRLGVPSSITFVPLWYKDTDVIKNGFYPTTCRGRSIKAKQMKFFIDAFWIRERGRSFVLLHLFLSFLQIIQIILFYWRLFLSLSLTYSFIFIASFFFPPLLCKMFLVFASSKKVITTLIFSFLYFEENLFAYSSLSFNRFY